MILMTNRHPYIYNFGIGESKSSLRIYPLPPFTPKKTCKLMTIMFPKKIKEKKINIAQ